MYKQYRKKTPIDVMPWSEDIDMSGVTVNPNDRYAGSPKLGDMIGRNPNNHADRWLISERYFAESYVPVE